MIWIRELLSARNCTKFTIKYKSSIYRYELITFPSIISKGRNFYLISFRCTIFIYLFIYFFPRIRKYGFYIFVRCGTRSYNATLIFEKRKINYLSGQSWKTRRDSDRKFNWNERTRFGNWKNCICIYIYIYTKKIREKSEIFKIFLVFARSAKIYPLKL